MKIIILGAGHIGGTLAEYLVSDSQNDITIIDNTPELLQQLQDRYDLRTVAGHASHPRVLKEAGADDADILLAMTNSDEVNIVACQIAYSLFNTPKRIARIRSQEYLTDENGQTLFTPDIMPVDNVISPENLVAENIFKLIENPGALQVVNFAEGKISLVSVTAYYGGPLVGEELSTIRDHIPHIEVRIVAIFRHDRPIRSQGSTIIEAGDEIFFITATPYIKAVISELQRLEKPYKRIIIAGGGLVGSCLAKKLENSYQVKIIEHRPDRIADLASKLQKTTVLQGVSSDQELLIDENIEQVDLFIAVTNDDDANIMSAMLAKKLGAKKTLVLIQRQAYIDLVQSDIIDITLSPQQATISALLNYVRKADIVNVFSLRRGIAEAIEIIAHGNQETSQVVGKKLSDLKLPVGTILGAIVRGETLFIRDNNIAIEEGDHIILFLTDKKYIHEIEDLFQPSALFL